MHRAVVTACVYRYTCKATNVAGTSDIQMTLRVLILPVIDKSNIIGNPLAIVNRSISLECPATGIPSPTVSWMKDAQPLRTDRCESVNSYAYPHNYCRVTLSTNNQTLKIDPVATGDEGRYTCMATNKAGNAEQDFNLEVLSRSPAPTHGCNMNDNAQSHHVLMPWICSK